MVRIRRSHRRGPGSIPGQGTHLDLCLNKSNTNYFPNYTAESHKFFNYCSTPYSVVQHFPGGLVVRIRRSHRRGPGSIPGQGTHLYVRINLIQTTFPNYTAENHFKLPHSA